MDELRGAAIAALISSTGPASVAAEWGLCPIDANV